MTELVVMLVEDRHADVEVRVFADETAAHTAMEQYLKQPWTNPDEQHDTHNEAMRRAGWLRHVTYSCEGCCVSLRKVSLEG